MRVIILLSLVLLIVCASSCHTPRFLLNLFFLKIIYSHFNKCVVIIITLFFSKWWWWWWWYDEDDEDDEDEDDDLRLMVPSKSKSHRSLFWGKIASSFFSKLSPLCECVAITGYEDYDRGLRRLMAREGEEVLARNCVKKRTRQQTIFLKSAWKWAIVIKTLSTGWQSQVNSSSSTMLSNIRPRIETQENGSVLQ